MWTWISNHRMPIAISLVLLVGIVFACLGYWYSQDTPPPSVPEVGTTAQTQTAVNSAVRQVQETREKSDERIRKAYQDARKGVDCLSADAVVAELNALLDELRQRDAE